MTTLEASSPRESQISPFDTSLRLFELRSYRARPGKRDELIAMFEAHFLDAYENAGAHILMSFRDLDVPERWVWMRAFADGERRAAALSGFYASPIWHDMRKAANATIEKSSDAMLLSPLSPLGQGWMGPNDVGSPARTVIECQRLLCRHKPNDALKDLILNRALPILTDLGGEPVASFATAEVANSYPRQRLRRTPALVVITRHRNLESHRDYVAARGKSAAWRALEANLQDHLRAPFERWRLQPTQRSVLR